MPAGGNERERRMALLQAPVLERAELEEARPGQDEEEAGPSEQLGHLALLLGEAHSRAEVFVDLGEVLRRRRIDAAPHQVDFYPGSIALIELMKSGRVGPLCNPGQELCHGAVAHPGPGPGPQGHPIANHSQSLDRCPKDTAGGPAWIRLADEVAFPSPIAGIIVL